MRTFSIQFEHLTFGTKYQIGVEARNVLCAIVKAARGLGFTSKLKNNSWHFVWPASIRGPVACFRVDRIA